MNVPPRKILNSTADVAVLSHSSSTRSSNVPSVARNDTGARTIDRVPASQTEADRPPRLLYATTQ